MDVPSYRMTSFFYTYQETTWDISSAWYSAVQGGILI